MQKSFYERRLMNKANSKLLQNDTRTMGSCLLQEKIKRNRRMLITIRLLGSCIILITNKFREAI